MSQTFWHKVDVLGVALFLPLGQFPIWNKFMKDGQDRSFSTIAFVSLEQFAGQKVIKILVRYIYGLRQDILIRAGAIFSSAGTVLLALFILILLIFPVVKNCPNQEQCDYHTTAPEPLNYFITPLFVAVDLFVIASGVLFMRFARWYKYKV